MTDIARLGIEIDTRQVDQGAKSLDGLSAAGGRATKATDVMIASAARMGLAIGAAVTATALLVKRTVDAADAMNDMHLKTGLAFRDLAAYDLLARQSGTSVNALADGFKFLGKYAVEHGDKLRALGVTSKDLNGQMAQFADVIAGIRDPALRSTLAMQVLGRSGVELIPALVGGSAAFDRARTASAAYGDALERLAPKADDLNDKLAELKTIGAGWATSWSEPIVDGVLKVVNALNLEINAAPGSILHWMRTQGGGADIKTGQQVLDAMRRGGAASKPAATSDAVIRSIITEADAASKAADAVRDHVAALMLESQQLGLTEIQQKMVAEAAYAATLGTAAQREAVMTAAAAWAQKRAATDAATEAEKLAADAIKAAADAERNATKSLDGRIAAINDDTAALTMTAAQLREHIILRELEKSGLDESAAAYAAYDKALRDAYARNDVARETKKATDEQTKMWERLEDTGRQTFVSWANGAKDFAQRAKESLKNILFDWLWQMTARKWILNVGASVGVGGAGAAGASPGGVIGGFGGGGFSMPSLGGMYGNGIGVGIADAAQWLSSGSATGPAAPGTLGSMFAGAGQYGNWQYGLAGLGGGLVGGMIGGEAGGSLGGIGTSIGLAMGGPIGAAIGAVGGGVLGKLFGGGGEDPHNNADTAGVRYRFSSAGIAGTGRVPEDGASMAVVPYSFVAGQTSGSGRWADSVALTSEQIGAIDQQVRALYSSASTLATQLGVSDSALQALTIDIDQHTSATEGVGVAVQKSLETLSTALIDKLGVSIQHLLQPGETTVQMLVRITGNLMRVRSMLGNINRAFDLSGESAVKFSETLITKFGGLDQLSATLGTYYDTYFTQAEKTAKLTDDISTALEALGYNMPTTLEGFRAIVEAQDLTTESGQATFASLMALSPAFAALVDASDAANESWSSTASNIADTIETIRGEFDDTSLSLAEAKANFALATAAARAGDSDAADKLSDLATKLVELGAEYNVSRADQELLIAQVAGSLETTLNAMSAVTTETAASLAIVSGATDVSSGAIATVISALTDTTAATTTATDTTAATTTTPVTTAATTTHVTLGGGFSALRERLIALGYTPSFAVGTSFVPNDMLANIHAGEEITPRPYVDAQRAARDETNELLESLRAEVAALRRDNSTENRAIAGHVATTARKIERFDDGDALSVRLVIASDDTPLPVV